MNKLIVALLTAALGACASNTGERRPAASAQTEPAPHHARHTGRAVHPDDAERAVTPAETAPAGRAMQRTQPARDVAPVRGDGRDVAPVHSPDADNTALNARERSGVTPTPLDQGNGSSDLDTTQKIRKALMQDDQLSFAAKNVKVISEQGQVTLRGSVKNEAEKRSIETYARQVVGAARVHNELDVQH